MTKQSYLIANYFQGFLSRISWGMENSVVVCSISLFVTSFQLPTSKCPCSSFKILVVWTTSMVTKSRDYISKSSSCSRDCTRNSSFCSKDCTSNSLCCSGYCTGNSSLCSRDCTSNSSLFSLLLYSYSMFYEQMVLAKIYVHADGYHQYLFQ